MEVEVSAGDGLMALLSVLCGLHLTRQCAAPLTTIQLLLLVYAARNDPTVYTDSAKFGLDISLNYFPQFSLLDCPFKCPLAK